MVATLKIQICCIPVFVILIASTGCESKSEPERAGDLFVQAMEASVDGNLDQAIDLFSQSLEVKPQPYAYLERAKLYLKKDQADLAIADCEAGLALDSEHRDLKWLLGECKKPKDQRFQGKNAKPPSSGK